MILLLLCSLAVPAQSPGLTCPVPLYQAGKVNSGTPINHTFRVRNTSPHPIVIDRVKAGCGCLHTKTSRLSLAPGQDADIVLKVNTLTQPAGENTWRTTVFYRVGKQAHELPLSIQATLVPVLTIRPATLLFTTSGALTGQFTLSERRDRPLMIRDSDAESSHVHIKVGEPTRDASGQWTRTIHLAIDERLPQGEHEGIVRLHTDDGVFGELTVPYRVVKRATSGVQVRPSRIEMIAAPKQPLPSRIVLLGRPDDKPLTINRIETGHARIKATWAAGPGTRVTVRVEAEDHVLANGPYRGTVRVILGDNSVVSIPLEARRR